MDILETLEQLVHGELDVDVLQDICTNDCAATMEIRLKGSVELTAHIHYVRECLNLGYLEQDNMQHVGGELAWSRGCCGETGTRAS